MLSMHQFNSSFTKENDSQTKAILVAFHVPYPWTIAALPSECQSPRSSSPSPFFLRHPSTLSLLCISLELRSPGSPLTCPCNCSGLSWCFCCCFSGSGREAGSLGCPGTILDCYGCYRETLLSGSAWCHFFSGSLRQALNLDLDCSQCDCPAQHQVGQDRHRLDLAGSAGLRTGNHQRYKAASRRKH